VPRVAESYKQTRRRQVMDAAIACFSREGFHRTTMKQIVDETGLSAGAIYRYFNSKEDIVAAIAEEHHTTEAAVLREMAQREDIAEGLRDLVLVSLGRLTDPTEQEWRRVTVQVWGEALRDDRVMQIVRGGLDEPLEILTDLFRRARREKLIPKGIDPAAAARVCAAIFQGLVLQHAWDSTVDVKRYIDTVLGIIDVLVRMPANLKAPSVAAGSVASRA
jgi:AcrR family transcriptional regulator